MPITIKAKKPSSIKFEANVPADIYEWLDAQATQDACPRASVIVRLVRAEMKRRQQGEAGQ